MIPFITIIVIVAVACFVAGRGYETEHRRGTPAISDHLEMLAFLAGAQPSGLMVELGVDKGNSTRSLLAAAEWNDSRVLSMDINDCRSNHVPNQHRWTFVQSDDVLFGQKQFVNWCHSKKIKPLIQTLFVDTSHNFHHTKQELEVWLPFLAPGGLAIFHDTNLIPNYPRRDGSVGGDGWDNRRGVIHAIEDFIGEPMDEKIPFTRQIDGMLIYHQPCGCGLTVIKP